MKSITTLVLSLFTFYNFSQINYKVLDQNSCSAFISDGGSFFSTFGTSSQLGYEVPYNSGVNVINGLSFWFAGTSDINETFLTLSANPGSKDLFNGPVSINDSYSNMDYQEDWNSAIWQISQDEIDVFVNYYECSQDPSCTIDYGLTTEITEKIISWPGTGNTVNGEAQYLAPFYDRNSNGLYEPSEGDYPLIKGCNAVYLIQNDARSVKTLSGSDKMDIEVHFMFYQFSAANSYLDQTTFVDVKVFNRGTIDFVDFKLSAQWDADAGNPTDDMFGCDSLNNLMYMYNGDGLDETVSTAGFENNLGSVGITSLNYDVNSIVPYNENMTYLNNINGNQSNGNLWMHPDGYETKFALSGNPSTQGSWNGIEENVQLTDFKGIMTTEHNQFISGSNFEQTFAIIFTQNSSNIQSVANLIEVAEDIQNIYPSLNSLDCENVVWGIEEEKEGFSFKLYPNPTNGMLSVSTSLNEIDLATVYNLQGQVVFQREIFSNSTILDLSHILPGNYIVEMRSKKGDLVRKKVVKM